MPATDPAQPPTQAPVLIPAQPDPRVARFFGWYTRRLFRKKFFAVRFMPGSDQVLRALADHPGPAIVVMTHGSWWDPMTAILLNNAFTAARPTAAPMDAAMLKRFGFFRKLGVFGIDPDSPASLEAMGGYMLGRFKDEPSTTLWITAQGHFHDPRTPPKLRPGAAWLAARVPGVRVLCCAIEYAFWTDQRPETFIRIKEAIPTPGTAPVPRASASEPMPVLRAPESALPSTTAWLRAMQSTMHEAVQELAAAVTARDPARFSCLSGGESTSVHPVFDLWQRLRGKSNAIEVRSLPAGAPRSGEHPA